MLSTAGEEICAHFGLSLTRAYGAGAANVVRHSE